MLFCLKDVTTKLAQIEGEYHRFNFDESGVTLAFMSITHPILVQAQVFSQIANDIDFRADPIMRLWLGQYPNIYFPRREELFKHFDGRQ